MKLGIYTISVWDYILYRNNNKQGTK
jgi:hypothetical protein